ncbi:MAG: glycosyl hydrolase [Algibacter sp.]
MKIKLIYVFVFLFAIKNMAQTTNCAAIVDEKFDVNGALPNNWTEYNTSGRITVDEGRLKFNHNATRPSAFTTFNAVTNNATFSFDVSATRSSVNCQINLVSSTGKYLSSTAVGVQTASIKYATSISSGGVPSGFTNGVPSVTFNTNTVYAVSAQVDFASKTVNFYANDALMAENIPFLEDAEDIAKIDIQLIYMWSNTGQFYFDNISLLSGDENRLQLTNDIIDAEKILASASVGTIYNQYPQSAVDAFQLAIDNANTIISDCESSTNVIDTSISDLEVAQAVFEASSVNNPVLKMYSGYDFTGEEYEVFPGYYNGGLGDYEDWAVSFTLEKGYMATFAQDVNGLGVSKIYIAQDDALEINLPNDLQHSISFIRVSPWYPVGKKGSLGGDIKWSSADNYNTTWHYSWGLDDQKSEGVQFVPMSWSKGDNWTSLENMEQIGQNMSFNHLLAFNEPDNAGQSNMTVEEALEAYPKLLASGLRLGAPGVENVQYSTSNDSFNDGAWIQEFMDGCIERGYRVDFIPAHDYVRRSKSAFLERFKGLHDRYNLPVWVTEYNYGNPNFGSSPLTVEQGYDNIKGLTETLEAADFIERYNWYYFFGPSTGIGGITDGELNITGQFYRDLESQNPSYIQEVYEQGALSINDFDEKQNKINLYPNPVTTPILNINYLESSISNNAVIKIFNTYGQEIIIETGAPKQIDVSNLSQGIYFVQIFSSEINIIKKIIIAQ